MRRRTFLGALLALPAAPLWAAGGAPTGIAWYGTWEAGLQEAKRLKRPILLISAAPQCNHVSGMW